MKKRIFLSVESCETCGHYRPIIEYGECELDWIQIPRPTKTICSLHTHTRVLAVDSLETKEQLSQLLELAQ